MSADEDLEEVLGGGGWEAAHAEVFKQQQASCLDSDPGGQKVREKTISKVRVLPTGNGNGGQW